MSRIPGPLAEKYGARALVARAARVQSLAEALRDDKLAEMDEPGRRMACDPEGPGSTAKFWLQNQRRSGKEIEGYFKDRREAMTALAALKARLERWMAYGSDDPVLDRIIALSSIQISIHDIPFEIGILEGRIMRLDDEFIPSSKAAESTP